MAAEPRRNRITLESSNPLLHQEEDAEPWNGDCSSRSTSSTRSLASSFNSFGSLKSLDRNSTSEDKMQSQLDATSTSDSQSHNVMGNVVGNNSYNKGNMADDDNMPVQASSCGDETWNAVSALANRTVDACSVDTRSSSSENGSSTAASTFDNTPVSLCHAVPATLCHAAPSSLCQAAAFAASELSSDGNSQASNITLFPQSATSSALPSLPRTTVDQTKEESIVNPVEYIKYLFSTNQSTQAWMERQYEYRFDRPSDQTVESYDLDVVRAIRIGNVGALRRMLHDEGRQFDASNRFGESLIHMACRRGDRNLVAFLIDEAKVRLDISDDFGRTPLHDACWTSKPNLEVVGLLLRKIPPSMLLSEDVRGHTPFQYSRKEHWPIWMSFLRENSHIILQRISLIQAIG